MGAKGFGACTPKNIIDNAYFEQFLGTLDEWISKMTGIKERHWVDEDQDISDLTYNASIKTAEDAGIQPVDIDTIIVATATGDVPSPGVANVLQEGLGTGRAATMDQLAACSGLMYSMIIVKQHVQSGSHKYILAVGADKLSKTTGMTDHSTAVLFGDGAGAVVMGEAAEGRGIISYEMGSDGNGSEYLYSDRETGKFKMNGREVLRFVVRIMGGASMCAVEKASLSPEDTDLFIPHQANIRVMESTRERLGIEREKMSASINKYGNTSAASILLNTSQELQNGEIRGDNTLTLTGFGGGLAWGAIAIKWEK